MKSEVQIFGKYRKECKSCNGCTHNHSLFAIFDRKYVCCYIIFNYLFIYLKQDNENVESTMQ